MSFDPTTNGVGSSYHCHPQTTAPFSPRPFHLISDLNSSERIAKLKATLSKQLGPEYISQRPGPGGTKLSYIEGWKAINLANEIFGFDGWASSITSLTVDYVRTLRLDAARTQLSATNPDRPQPGKAIFLHWCDSHRPGGFARRGLPRGCGVWYDRKCKTKRCCT